MNSVNKRFKVVSIHYTNECNCNCSFCYKLKMKKEPEKPLIFWLKLVPYLNQLTDQIALGGGEPFIHPYFVEQFAKVCKKNKLILNVTSNGKLLMDLNDRQLKTLLKDITMISLSFDKEKIKTKEDFKDYVRIVKRIKKLTKCQVGSNLLVDKEMFEIEGAFLIHLVAGLFGIGVDRVFALYPKNIKGPDILKYGQIYSYLTSKYEKFFADDLTRQILEQGKYKNWREPCHFGKDLISINESGYVTGCSFDNINKAVLKLDKPEEILKIKNYKFKERFNCPYLNIQKKTKVKGGQKRWN